MSITHILQRHFSYWSVVTLVFLSFLIHIISGNLSETNRTGHRKAGQILAPAFVCMDNVLDDGLSYQIMCGWFAIDLLANCAILKTYMRDWYISSQWLVFLSKEKLTYSPINFLDNKVNKVHVNKIFKQQRVLFKEIQSDSGEKLS